MRIPWKRKVSKSSPSEIDRVVAMAKKSTPEEFKQFTSSTFQKDLQFFKRLVMEQRERFEWAGNQPEVKYLLKKVKNFYDDLIADGHVKKNLSLLEGRSFEEYKVSQAREEAVSLLKKLRTNKHYKEVFRKWNKVYVINYETLCNSYLVTPAQKISSRAIKDKAKVLHTLSSYRNKKHGELFRSLIPQIRNSISHQDFIIDPKEPKITFFDRRKPPLELTIDEYYDIFWELYFLTMAFDIGYFDLQSGILDILIEAVDTVDNYLKKHGLKLVRAKEEALSLLDWAVLIKSGKIS